MTVRLKLFAACRQLAGRDELVLEIRDAATVADVRRAAIAASPLLAALVSGAMMAVNAEYASDDTPISAADEIACIPPVSGG